MRACILHFPVLAPVCPPHSPRPSFEALCPYPHKNIVTAYGVCTDAPDGQLRVVMELCVKSLWDLLQEQKGKVRTPHNNAAQCAFQSTRPGVSRLCNPAP
jgi:hypothetical protein